MNDRGEKMEESNFDYFKLVQFCPQTACYRENEKWPIDSSIGYSPCPNMPEGPEWTTHGLWPVKTGTKGPNDCISSAYLDSEVKKKLSSELKKVWPNYKFTKDNETFWSHEYKKHGSCYPNSQYHYFSKAIELVKEFNVGEILAEGGVTPGKTYRLERIYEAIERVFKQRGIVVIVKNPRMRANYLLEIQLCFDKTFAPMNCEKEDYDPQMEIVYPSILPSRKDNNWEANFVVVKEAIAA